ncbi:helix-turn-helix transcriptional regulator [Ohessyouella blattaphilus]|uniref:Helix-turn-helix domain-containing protein n=1 Tax=Ohessyouella blattaphilus TaxID=2949333 RepID=A0ABT1EJ55_9FIRM|nr:helix-turn-helix transcriptional regulator [Ohessyouella blattaphilus]MCP1109726.1 helix-turn-helix domain-containing protein [Ohessyouella blattaphilus]MCR8563120.1 helix-turn-helix domain-containing protein [Ohessyouella blattaphilus]
MRDKNVDNMGAVIKKARRDRGLTQEELAEKVGVGSRHIMALENEGKNPGYDVLAKIIQTLDFSADLIFRPDAVKHTAEQDLFISEFMACNDNEQRIVMETMRSLIRELRENGA